MSLRTPLGRVLGLGSAGDGPGHWWQQRVSAVGLALLGLWFLVSVLTLGGGDLAAVQGWIAAPLHAALLSVLVLTAAWHSQLGLRVIVEDYTDGAVKVALIVGLQFVHAVAAAVGVLAVLRIATGA
ncbi:MAG: succinate dehydrogenase, hydrophobic membrane anchor protein [Gammaproteobacteria bacterium]